jgi:hypothetical protein
MAHLSEQIIIVHSCFFVIRCGSMALDGGNVAALSGFLYVL